VRILVGPASTFTVDGAAPPTNSALLSAGAELRLANTRGISVQPVETTVPRYLSMIRSRGITQCVMAGLVPATHALLAAWLKQDVGARHKAGHDDRVILRQPDRNQL
jgi:hypothetical protein